MKRWKNILKSDMSIFYYINIVMFFLIYVPIIISGKMYIYLDIGADTYCNYIVLYAKSHNMLRSILDFSIWDTTLGLGTSNAYLFSYIIDPSNWLIFLFSDYNVDIGIFLSLIIKFIVLSYFSYRYLEIIGLKGKALIVASVAYCFSGWFIGWGQHYPFASMFVAFTIALYYLEVWFRNNRWLGLVFSVAVLAVLSPYYTYMTFIYFALYYVYRYNGLLKTSVISFILTGIKTMGLCLWGLGISGIMFFPMVEQLLASPRVNGRLFPSFELGTKVEYISIISRFFSNNILGINEFVGYHNYYESPFLYTGLLIFFILPIFLSKKFLRKKEISIILFTVFCLFFVNFSLPIFNGFSTLSYRWTFVLVPGMVFLLGKGIMILEANNFIIKKLYYCAPFTFISTFIISYITYIFKSTQNSDDQIIIRSIIIVIITNSCYFIIFIAFKNKKKTLINLLAFVLICEITSNSYTSVNNRSLIPSQDKKTMEYYNKDTEDAINYIKETDSKFYRIYKKYAYIDLNDSQIQDYTGEKYYAPTLTRSYWSIMDTFDLRIKNSNYFFGLEDKQFLRNILCGKYMITCEDKEYYGYQKIYNNATRFVYKNDKSSPFGVLYNSFITIEDYAKLNENQKQNVLYKACIINQVDIGEFSNINNAPIIVNNKLNQFKFEYEIDDSNIIIKLAKNTINPLSIKIKAINTGVLNGQINIKTSIETDYGPYDYIPISLMENEQKSYYVNTLGVNEIKITLTNPVNPDIINNIEIFENITENSNVISNENSLQIQEYSENRIKGNIENNSAEILFLPIVYDENWKVNVNGKEQKVYQINSGFCGIILEPGKNDIEFYYESKWVLFGVFITLSSFVFVIGINLFAYKKKRKIKKKEIH